MSYSGYAAIMRNNSLFIWMCGWDGSQLNELAVREHSVRQYPSHRYLRLEVKLEKFKLRVILVLTNGYLLLGNVEKYISDSYARRDKYTTMVNVLPTRHAQPLTCVALTCILMSCSWSFTQWFMRNICSNNPFFSLYQWNYRMLKLWKLNKEWVNAKE